MIGVELVTDKVSVEFLPQLVVFFKGIIDEAFLISTAVNFETT